LPCPAGEHKYHSLLVDHYGALFLNITLKTFAHHQQQQQYTDARNAVGDLALLYAASSLIYGKS